MELRRCDVCEQVKERMKVGDWYAFILQMRSSGDFPSVRPHPIDVCRDCAVKLELECVKKDSRGDYLDISGKPLARMLVTEMRRVVKEATDGNVPAVQPTNPG